MKFYLKFHFMQIYALDDNQRLVSAYHALRQHDYFCLECQSPVRLRGGFHRRSHFYHLQPIRSCRLSEKSMVHLQVQFYLQEILPEGECFLEHRFSEVNRIADVFWQPAGIVFEVQCSGISAEEVKKRNQDYQKLGLCVVWILHDRRFNRWRVTAAELLLRKAHFYYTNFDAEGNGIIYDQFDVVERGIRKNILPPLSVNLAEPISMRTFFKKAFVKKNSALKIVTLRLKWGVLFFSGDIVDRYFSSSDSPEKEEYLSKIQALEERQEKLGNDNPPSDSFFGNIKKRLRNAFITPYRHFFQIMLERACKR